MKAKTKKISIVIICLVFILSCFGCRELGKHDVEQKDILRGNVKYEDMYFAAFDGARINYIIDELNKAIVKSDNDEAVAKLFDELIDEKSRLDDSYLKLMVDYYTDTNNNAKFEAYSKADNEFTFITDDFYVVIALVLDSEYEYIADELIESRYVDKLKDYDGIKEEQIPLYEKISELQSKYNEYYSGNATIEVVYNGKSYTWADIEDYAKFSNYNEFVEVYYALLKEENNIMGSILLEQVSVRNEIARSEGYENYYEMVWNDGYYREYEYDDFEKIASFVKEYLCENINQFEKQSSKDYITCSECNFDLDLFYERLINAEVLMPNVKEAVEYINEYELLLLGGEGDYNVGFSTKFETYEEPFVYVVGKEGKYGLDTLCTLAHETGHAVNFYYDYSNSINCVFQDLDVAELQSTSFPLMYIHAISDLYPEYKNVIERRIVGEAVSTLQNCGFQTEVEHLLYTSEGLSVDDINRLAGEIAIEYKFDDVIVDGECILWSGIPHYSDAPGYVVSYVMSDIGSLCLWMKYENESEDMIEVYDEIITENTSNTNYKELIEKYDLENIYERSFYKSLKKYVEKYQ